MGRKISRRDMMQVAGLAAAGAALAAKAAAQPAAAPPRAATLGGGAEPGGIFWTVETTAGRVQGIANGRIK